MIKSLEQISVCTDREIILCIDGVVMVYHRKVFDPIDFEAFYDEMVED